MPFCIAAAQGTRLSIDVPLLTCSFAAQQGLEQAGRDSQLHRCRFESGTRMRAWLISNKPGDCAGAVTSVEAQTPASLESCPFSPTRALKLLWTSSSSNRTGIVAFELSDLSWAAQSEFALAERRKPLATLW